MSIEQLLNLRNMINENDDVKFTVKINLDSINTEWNGLTKLDIQKVFEMKTNSIETMFSVEELTKIFNVTKVTIRNWYKAGIIKKKQEVINGNVKISESSIDGMVKNYPKYSNAWINYKVLNKK